METPAKIDVLIVGAGPTGLMLANQLARRGVQILIIDKNPGPSVRTKALGVQARTLEIYSHLGIAGRAVELGSPTAAINLWAQGRHAARVPLGDIGHDLSPFPFLLILGQDHNERLLGEALRSRAVHVQWSTELKGLTQTPDHVTAALARPDGSTFEVTADWVAGCDGAHSAVRTLSGIPFIGAPYEHVFFIADTLATGPMAPGELNVYLWRTGFHLFFPMRGKDHWRVIGILPPELRNRDNLEFDAVIPSVRAEVGPSLAFQGCTWFSTYRIHHRRARQFRDRRCFLLGDAAHIHSPVSAQGMNTGLQDAYNLGWKLALIARGAADPGGPLLDSYSLERIPVADRLLRTTDKAFAAFVSERWLPRQFRTRLLPGLLRFALKREPFRKFAFHTISQIGIRYPQSPLSQNLPDLPTGSPRAGDRFPWLRLSLSPGGPVEDLFARLDDTRFTLIAMGQAAPPASPPDWGDLLVTLTVPDAPINDPELRRTGIPRPSFFLLRPDGHIALAGARFDAAALGRYPAERVHLRRPESDQNSGLGSRFVN